MTETSVMISAHPVIPVRDMRSALDKYTDQLGFDMAFDDAANPGDLISYASARRARSQAVIIQPQTQLTVELDRLQAQPQGTDDEAKSTKIPRSLASPGRPPANRQKMSRPEREVKPLDPEQYRLWHRLRRMPWFLFVIVLGAILTSGAIVGLNVLMTLLFVGLTPGAHVLLLMYGVLFVVVGGAFAWTWSYMQRRYHATRNLRCPHCGYLVIGITSEQCPECGTRFS